MLWRSVQFCRVWDDEGLAAGMGKGCVSGRFAKGGMPALGVSLLPRAVLPWPPAVCSTRPVQAEPIGSMLVLDSTAA